MVKYSLADHYNEAERNKYTLEDLDRYWRSLRSTESDEMGRDSVGYAHKKLVLFLQEHGKTKNRIKLIPQAENQEDQEDQLEIATHIKKEPHVMLFQKTHPLSSEEPKEESFSYLQLLCYIMEKAGQHSMTVGGLLKLIDNPSQVHIPLYKEILADLDDMISDEEKERVKNIDHRADVVWISHELISLIAYSSFRDYANVPDILDPTAFIAQSKERIFPDFHGLLIRPERNYFDAFYSIVAFAQTSAEIVDMLNAFQKVKRGFSTGHSSIPECERMMHSKYSKVDKNDNAVLAYQDGKIIEIWADQVEILNDQPSNAEYMRALEQYIDGHLRELAVKVFCLDDPRHIGKENMKQYKRKLKRKVKAVAGFKAFETDRYKSQPELSKAKLISIFQVILLSEQKAGVTDGRDHATKNRLDRANGVDARENKSYSSLFGEDPEGPTYRDSYSQQELCIWVYYQTLKNIASDQWAANYLDINIAALEAILDDRNSLTPDQVQRKAEMMLRMAVRMLIRKEDDAEECDSLYFLLQSALGRNTVIFTTGTFRQKAVLYRLGAFLRLFNVEEVKKKFEEYVEYIYASQENSNGTGSVVIDPYYTGINELAPLCIEIYWEKESDSVWLTLKDLTGF